jgi:hypothetical protein
MNTRFVFSDTNTIIAKKPQKFITVFCIQLIIIEKKSKYFTSGSPG